MVQKKGHTRAERRQPGPPLLPPSLGKDPKTDKPSAPHFISSQTNSSSSKSRASRKRGQMSKSLARTRVEKGVEKADRLRAKASKRQHQLDKKKRAKES